MGLKIIQPRRQTVRVIQPDGQIRQFLVPIKVSDLLVLHPHHFVSPAKTNPNKKNKASILPLDMQLESGDIYILLPLPRLFPCSFSSSSSSSFSCSCFQEISYLHSEIVLKRHWGGAVGVAPLRVEKVVSFAETQKLNKQSRIRVWEPALEVISENRLLLRTKAEEESERDNKRGSRKGLKPRFGVLSGKRDCR